MTTAEVQSTIPLPQPGCWSLFYPEQMAAYGDARAAEERERCAAIAESWATKETATTCANVAAAIRGA